MLTYYIIQITEHIPKNIPLIYSKQSEKQVDEYERDGDGELIRLCV